MSNICSRKTVLVIYVNVFICLTEMVKLRIFYAIFKFQYFASRKTVLVIYVNVLD